jgi:glycosyltransferase involved in cell wall biosynthesis
MPNYNCSRYLPEAIESVLKQSYIDFEFIIIDDCSTDESLGIIKNYAQKDRRIVVRVNNKNIGQAKNLNLCLKYSKGEYIKFVFSDDMLFSADAIKKMVEILDADNEIALVASARYSIDEKTDVRGILSDYKGNIKSLGTEIIKDSLFSQRNKIGEPSVVMFRRRFAKRGFNEKYNQNVDWEMWFHILEQGNFAYIDEPLCSFRTHLLQQTSLNREKQIHLIEPFYLLRDYAQKPYVDFLMFKKAYVLYLPAYEIWREFKKFRRISLLAAIRKIHRHYNLFKFIAIYPIFKIYKTTMSIMRRLKLN